MPVSEVFSLIAVNGGACAPVQRNRPAVRKRITIKHPRLTAWADLGTIIRISLRHNPRTAVNDDHDVAPILVAPPSAISGPFFDGADTQHRGE